MKRILTALACMIVTGCVFSQIEEGMNALVGRPADQLFSYIGYPNGEQVVAGQRLLVYSTDYTVSIPQQQTAQTSGSVYGTGGYATYSGTTTYSTTENVQMYCELRVAVDTNYIIQSWQFYGNMGGCSRYSSVGKAAKTASASVAPVPVPKQTFSYDPKMLSDELYDARREWLDRCGKKTGVWSENQCHAKVDDCMRISPSDDGRLACLQGLLD